MMSMHSLLEPIGKALSSVVPNSYHYWRPNLAAPFLIWGETSDTGFEAGNSKGEQGFEGKTDYYTTTDDWQNTPLTAQIFRNHC